MLSYVRGIWFLMTSQRVLSATGDLGVSAAFLASTAQLREPLALYRTRVPDWEALAIERLHVEVDESTIALGERERHRQEDVLRSQLQALGAMGRFL